MIASAWYQRLHTTLPPLFKIPTFPFLHLTTLPRHRLDPFKLACRSAAPGRPVSGAASRSRTPSIRFIRGRQRHPRALAPSTFGAPASSIISKLTLAPSSPRCVTQTPRSPALSFPSDHLHLTSRLPRHKRTFLLNKTPFHFATSLPDQRPAVLARERKLTKTSGTLQHMPSCFRQHLTQVRRQAFFLHRLW